MCLFFFKQKTAYDMRISDWSSDVCSSDLAGYRHVGGQPGEAWEEFSRTGRLSWVSDLAEIQQAHGVSNVCADIGQSFANTIIDDPRVAAAMLGKIGRA